MKLQPRYLSHVVFRKDDMGQAIGSRGLTLVRPAGSGTRAGLQSANRDLAACLGFQADDPNGRVGTVVGIAFGSQTDRPQGIEIRVGLFHRTVITVPVEAVAMIDPSRKRITLNSTRTVGIYRGAAHNILHTDWP